MSLECLDWGPGAGFHKPYRRTPYESVVARERYLWFVVEDEAEVVQSFNLARCEWKLIKAYTSDRRGSLGEFDEWMRVMDTGAPIYCLIYERVTDAPKCGPFS